MSNRGCQVVAWGIMFLCAIGLLYTGSCTSLFRSATQGDQAPQPVIAVIAGNNITEKQVNDLVAAMTKQLPDTGDTGDPMVQFGITSTALHQLVDGATVEAMAKENGIAVSDDEIVKKLSDEFDQKILGLKQQLIAQKKLKADATEAEFQAVVTKLTGGKGLAAVKEAQIGRFQAALKDPNQRSGLVTEYLQAALVAKFQSSVAVDDETLKRSFDQFVVRRLPFSKKGVTADELRTQAEKALGEIQGGLKFDAAMAKYAPGAPVDPTRYSRQALSSSPDLKPLLDLKPGQTSAVVEEFGVPTIFQLVKVEPNVPKDFDKQKPLFAQVYRQQGAAQRLDEERQKMMASKAVEWKSPAYKLVYDLDAFMRKSAFSPTAKEKLKEFADSAASVDDPLGAGVASAARYAAFETYFAMLTPAEKQQEYDNRVEVMNGALEFTESYTVRLALADLLTSHKDGEQAVEQLQRAAENNRDFNTAAVKLTSDIQARIDKGVKTGVFTAEMAAPVRKELDRWRKDKAEDEKTQAEVKAEEAKSKLQAEEDIRKENEANLKEEAKEKAAKAPATKPAGGH